MNPLSIVLGAIGVVALLLAARAQPATPEYTIVPVDPAALRLFWGDEAGKPFRSFRRLDDWLRKKGQRLAVAMNAGMYHADLAPVGLLVLEGREQAPINRARGQGNFFLEPNGVFYVDAQGGAHVVATDEFPDQAADVRLATQSGPLLVRRGQVHPAFHPGSKSRHVRNGVGICAGKPVLVISHRRVTLHEFATYFRDTLGCPDALYLDGAVSSLHSASLRRSDRHAVLGPILAVVEPDPGQQHRGR